MGPETDWVPPEKPAHDAHAWSPGDKGLNTCGSSTSVHLFHTPHNQQKCGYFCDVGSEIARSGAAFRRYCAPICASLVCPSAVRGNGCMVVTQDVSAGAVAHSRLIHSLQAGSTMKSSTPRDAVQLSPNAVTVLEKRYLVKDDGGRAGGDTERPVLAGGAHRGGGGPEVRRDREAGGAGGAGVLRHHGRPAVHAELADPDERRPAAGPALRLLRAAGGRRALQRQERHLRHPPRHGPGAPVGRRHRLQLLPAPAQERHRPHPPWAWPRARSPS